MEKIDLTFFQNLGFQLHSLTELSPYGENRVDILIAGLTIMSTIDNLIVSFPTLNVCLGKKDELFKAINEGRRWFKQASNEDKEKKDSSIDWKFREIINRAKEFEVVLTAELQTLAVYHVTQKGIYSTSDLIVKAENTLPQSILLKVNQQVIEEIRQSGRCLALDCGTACAFHIMRAIEMVMHEYYVAVCKPNPKPRKRLNNWGAYIDKFRNSPKPEVTEIAVLLQQIKDKHRNLIMHPDITLSMDEAFTTFEIAQGVIIAMAAKLPKL
jgi:hypothetical protein